MNSKITVLILVDGMRHDYINHIDSPFLYNLKEHNIDATVRETFAFELRPAFFAGLQPNECDIANMFCYDPLNSIFNSIDVRNKNRDEITKDVRKEAEKKGYSIVKHIGGCENIPLDLLKYFDFSEKYHTADAGSLGDHKTLFDYLRDARKEWLWIAYPEGPGTTVGVLQEFYRKVTYREAFIYLHFSELDWVGHKYGPHSKEQKKILKEIDDAIRKILVNLNQTVEQVQSIIFGDHGQVAINKNIDIAKHLEETNLELGKDYLYFLDSTQARFWFFTKDAKKKVVDVLNKIKDGRILTDSELMKLHFQFEHSKFGEVVFVVNNGVGIFPNFFQKNSPCEGLHGYLPEIEENWAKLILSGVGIKKKCTKPIEMVSIFPTLLEMLGFRKPANLSTSSIFQIEELKYKQEKYDTSIILPTFNRVDKLKKCMQTIENQSFPKNKLELIIVDDGSSDGTETYLNEYQNTTSLRIKYLRQTNSGPAAARNVGIENAEGKIIILIGDDMEIGDQEFINRHVEFHNEWNMLSHACLGFIDWSPSIKKNLFLDLITSKDGGQQFAYSYIESQDKDNIGWIGFLGSNISFKKAFVLTYGLFNKDVFKDAMWEDIELGYRLEKFGLKIHYRKDCIVYHNHPMDIKQFAKRQKKVGWYNKDVVNLGVPVEYSLNEFEMKKLYSNNILTYLIDILNEIPTNLERENKEIVKRMYNFALRYSELTGFMDRKGELDEKLNGPIGLIYNLVLAEDTLSASNQEIDRHKRHLNENDITIQELTNRITNGELEINDLRLELKSHYDRLNVLISKLAEQQKLLDSIFDSKAWKLITLFRKLRYLLFPKEGYREKLARLLYRNTKKVILKTQGSLLVIRKAKRYCRRNGIVKTLQKSRKEITSKKSANEKIESIIKNYPEKFCSVAGNKKKIGPMLAALELSAQEALKQTMEKINISGDAKELLNAIKVFFGNERYYFAIYDIFTFERTICHLNEKAIYPLVKASELPVDSTVNHRKNILFITALFPNPHHGGGNRVLNFIKALSENNDIYLFTPYEAQEDESTYQAIAPYCKRVRTIPYSKFGGNQDEISKWLDGQYMDIVHYEWPRSIENYSRNYGRFHIFTYMEAVSLRLLMDMRFLTPMTAAWIDKFALLLNALSIEVAQTVDLDARIAVTTKDGNFFKNIFPHQEYTVLNHGLSFDEFSLPEIDPEPNTLVFVGNYTHYPNVDAMEYFFRVIWGDICKVVPDIKIYIVGANPSTDLMQCADGVRIIVTGKVSDVRPYIQKASLCIAPLITGAGLRGKVIEYAALRRTFVATSIATSDLVFRDGVEYLCADTANDFSQCVIQLLKDENMRKQMARKAFDTALEHYDTRHLVGFLNRLYNRLEKNTIVQN